MDIKTAVEKAINECIAKGILAEFLTSQKAAVIAMSIFEYNEEIEMKKIRALDYNEGKEEGRKEGIEVGREEKLRNLVEIKVRKGKSLETIADELKQ